MGVVERLSFEAASGRTLLACEHVHRYRLAARLCGDARVLDLACGSGYGSAILREVAASVVGVDVDVATVDAAAARIGRDSGIRFVAADAAEYLRRDEAGDFDVVVCFEGLEHLPDLEDAAAGLRRLAGEGTKMILSVPNSQAFEEENEFHLTDFSYESAMELFHSLGSVTILTQFLAEGSLIRGEDGGPLMGEELLEEHGEVEWANTFIALVNFGPDEVPTLPSARTWLTVAPRYNRHMRSLERANREFWRDNARLARMRFRQFDTAAAAALDKQNQLRTAQERIRQLEGQVQDLQGAEEAAAENASKAGELWEIVQDLQTELGRELRRPGARARRLAGRALRRGR